MYEVDSNVVRPGRYPKSLLLLASRFRSRKTATEIIAVAIQSAVTIVRFRSMPTLARTTKIMVDGISDSTRPAKRKAKASDKNAMRPMPTRPTNPNPDWSARGGTASPRSLHESEISCHTNDQVRPSGSPNVKV